jgi:AcrR family transcriptional regulator
VLAAARGLFVSRGYAGTSMRAIADAAGVPVQTVELAFSTKRALLAAAIEATAAGTDRTVPAADRPWARATAASSDPFELLSRHAMNVRATLERISGLVNVLRAAAANDPELTQLSSDLDARRLAEARAVVTELANRGALRAELNVGEAIDVLWLLQEPLTYERLVIARGWSPAMYQTWLVEAAARLLLRLPSRR